MDIKPPDNSRIKIDAGINGTDYSWQNGKRSILAYPLAVLLVLFLGLWFVGELGAIKSLIEEDSPLSENLFELFWLGGWTIGGIMILFFIYALVRPQKRALLKLSEARFRYETGTEPFDFLSLYCGRPGQSSRPFGRFRNKVYEVDSRSINNLRLERVGERLRLSFDLGADRIEIGKSLTEPEREWLFQVLKEHSGSAS